jgi:hypothetical protein
LFTALPLSRAVYVFLTFIPMKRILSLLFALSLVASASHAQSTMPAIGTNTPKGQVAKTDASLNQASADTSSANRKNMKPSKRVQKIKMNKNSSGGSMQ